MGYKNSKKIVRVPGHYLWQITVIMGLCSIVYYLPVIAGAAGWTTLQVMLGKLHDFYGIDFYALVFFAPVVYTAYILGVIGSLSVALVCMLILLPYAILIDPYPNALFKPTAFTIILSAVGAVVAMLQKSDEQRHRSMKELKCLYDIGKAAEESDSVESFISSVVEIVPQVMQHPEDTKVRVTLRDKVFESSGFQENFIKVAEDLVVGGEVLGSVEIHSTRGSPYLDKHNHLTKTLSERISGAVREIELEQSLQGYYQQMEEMVDERTRDLEQIQDKLIRSERLVAVGELASGVGHELRNPLNVIRNCVYLLHMVMADKKDEEALKTLKLLDKQVDISNRIVTDLLDFTRIKAPSLTKVNLNNVVTESLSWTTVPGRIAVTTNLDGDSPQVRGDAEQIGRVFTNIISNAVQAMNGKGELKVSTGANDGYVWASFEDTGCGIPEENLDRIFEPLFTTKPKGIGLGLAITKRLIEQNKGMVEVSSQVAKGTTFTVRLPVHKGR